MARVPVAEGVFTWPSDEPALIGSRCVTCGNHMFPVQSGCPKCSGDTTETVETKTTELVDSLEVASLKFLNSITERREAVAEPADATASARATERILGAARA